MLLVGLYIIPAIEFNVQLGKAVAWIIGVVLVLLGLLFLSETPIGGSLGIVSGVFAVPPVRQFLTSQLDYELGPGVTAAVVLAVP